MHVEWFGQSAFALTAPKAKVFIDPFADLSPLAGRGMKFDYPPISTEGVFLDDAEEFLARMGRVERLPAANFRLEDLPAGDGTLVVVAAAP